MVRPAVALATALLVLAAGAGATSPSGGPKKPGYLFADCLHEPDNLNPVTSNQAASTDFVNLLYCSLLGQDERLELYPELAEQVPSIENGGISGDGRTITFRLKKGLVFSDGTPVTSADVAYTYKLWKDYGYYAEPFEKIERCETSDPLVLVIRLKEVYAPAVLDYGAVPVMPKSRFEAMKDIKEIEKLPYNRAPIACGAYTVEKWEPDSYVTLVRNPRYHRGPAAIERIVMKVIPDHNTRLTQLMTGELDWYTDLEWQQLGRTREIPGIETKVIPSMVYQHLDFNLGRAALQDVRLRRAFAHAIDKKAIVDALWGGQAVVATGEVAPQVAWAYDAEAKDYGYDVARARALLAEAGFVAGKDGIAARDGERLSLEIVFGAETKVVERTASILQQQLKAVGVEIRLRAYPGQILFAMKRDGGILQNGTFDLALFAWGSTSDPSSAANIWRADRVPPDGQNFCRYANREVDKLWDAAVRTNVRAERAALYRRIQRSLHDDLPSIPLFWRPELLAHKTGLAGVRPHPAGNVRHLWNPWEWRWQPRP